MDSSEHRRQVIHVLNWVALLHRIKWGKKMSYQEVAKEYMSIYMYEENMEKAVLFSTVMSRDH